MICTKKNILKTKDSFNILSPTIPNMSVRTSAAVSLISLSDMPRSKFGQ